MMLMINILKSFFAQTQLSEILVTISELNKEKTEEKAVMKSSNDRNDIVLIKYEQ